MQRYSGSVGRVPLTDFTGFGDAVRMDLATALIRGGDYLARMDRAEVVVPLALPQEGFVLPPLKAMHLGVAVVTRDCPGGREHCIDGVNCLVEARNAAGIGAAGRLPLADPGPRNALRAGGAAMVAGRSLTREGDRHIDILRGLAPTPS